MDLKGMGSLFWPVSFLSYVMLGQNSCIPREPGPALEFGWCFRSKGSVHISTISFSRLEGPLGA